ncbi:hypothetical protein DPMN_175687 [Dreissena polymorpha]|uniref:Uncharacterized protein n=1 Tax=Dreissena polymorpha TaxID=45954 RepID=A0A9D4E732_DREPO|nr:hypothetical protein DPMN_175687 [Dreissena polymorpha]
MNAALDKNPVKAKCVILADFTGSYLQWPPCPVEYKLKMLKQTRISRSAFKDSNLTTKELAGQQQGNFHLSVLP